MIRSEIVDDVLRDIDARKRLLRRLRRGQHVGRVSRFIPVPAAANLLFISMRARCSPMSCARPGLLARERHDIPTEMRVIVRKDSAVNTCVPSGRSGR